MENNFINLSRHDVIYVTGDDHTEKFPITSRVEQLIKRINTINWERENSLIFSEDGLEREILRPGTQGWQKGIVRVSIEFMPVPEAAELEECPLENDEQDSSVAENPLDVIRQAALQNNS